MANNSFEGGRQFPYPLVEDGKGYQRALSSRARAILSALMNLLPSNYESTVVGPNYTLFLKAFAEELARMALTLERLVDSTDFERVPSEFLWETVGYLVFLNGQIPDLDFDDESFRNFLLAVIDIYFQGSTPEAIASGISLFTDAQFTIRELYEDARTPGSPYDISDQFSFLVDFELQGQFPTNPLQLDANTRLLLEIIRPAHTLYRLRFLFGEDVSELIEAIEDAVSYDLKLYYYDDARRYCEGLAGFSSTTGQIALPDLSLLTDSDATKPLSKVARGARLVIPEGPNTGWYRVVANLGSSVQVFPRFKTAEAGLSYTLEIDRYGKKQEILVSGETPITSVTLDRFSVDAGGPYTIEEFTVDTLTATATGAAGTVTYLWDFTGNNSYDDATGASPSYTAPNGPSSRVVSVFATDALGRSSKSFATITITDTGQIQAYGTGSGTASGTFVGFGTASGSASGTGTSTGSRIKNGTVSATGTGTGQILSSTSLLGNSSGSGSGVGSITAQKNAQGQVQGVSQGNATAQASRNVPGMISASGEGVGTASGTVS